MTSNISKFEFVPLDISGKNYLSWFLDTKMHLTSEGLQETKKIENTTTIQQKAKALIFLRHHLHVDLQNEYLTKENPDTLWRN